MGSWIIIIDVMKIKIMGYWNNVLTGMMEE